MKLQLPKLFKIQPEYISVHIPKTAGSSLHKILSNNYGRHLKHIQTPEDIRCWSRGDAYKCEKPQVKIVHGHIRPHINWRTQYPQANWICWLRDPLKRSVSAYYHLKRTQDLGGNNQNLYKQKQPDLLSFIKDEDFYPATRIYSSFLKGFEVSDFFFVGETEHFDADMKKLATKMRIEFTPGKVRENTNRYDLNLLPEEELEVRNELVSEYEIYNRMLKKQ